jgi:glycosyltransferase involved in cell wall biosynthesis
MSRRLRIAHVVTTAGPGPGMGGPLRVALDQAHELVRRGHDVTLVAAWRDRDFGPTHLEGVRSVLPPAKVLVPRFPFSSLVSPSADAAVRTVVASSDVVHVHLARDAVPLLAATHAVRHGVPYVTQTHGMVFPDGRRLVRLIDAVATRRALRLASTRFVLTPHEAADVEAVQPSPTTILRNGMPESTQPPAAPTERDGHPEVLFLARLKANKQPMVFAEAARRVHERGVPGRFTLVGPDQGQLAALQRFIETHDAGSYLSYAGEVPTSDSRSRLRQASVYVLPSSHDPFPVSVLEAMAEGVPCVVSSGCLFAEELRDSGAAVVVDPTVDEVADAVAGLLDDPQRRALLGKRALEVISESFSIHAVVDELERSYARALESRTSPTVRRTEAP